MRLYLAVLYDTHVQEHMSSRCMSEYALSKVGSLPLPTHTYLSILHPSLSSVQCTFSPARETQVNFDMRR